MLTKNCILYLYWCACLCLLWYLLYLYNCSYCVLDASWNLRSQNHHSLRCSPNFLNEKFCYSALSNVSSIVFFLLPPPCEHQFLLFFDNKVLWYWSNSQRRDPFVLHSLYYSCRWTCYRINFIFISFFFPASVMHRLWATFISHMLDLRGAIMLTLGIHKIVPELSGFRLHMKGYIMEKYCVQCL